MLFIGLVVAADSEISRLVSLRHDYGDPRIADIVSWQGLANGE
jgi:hypothetical protein